MASSTTPIKSVGTTLKVASGTGSSSSATVGKLKSIGAINPTADEIDVTTLDSSGGYKDYLQGFKDGGEVSCEGFLAYGDAGQAQVVTLFDSGDKKTWTVEYPDGTKASFSAYVKGYTIGDAAVDGAVNFALNLRVCGAVTITAAS